MMTKVHYFQRYSQKENVVTNNTLLLLSRLYAHNPEYFQAVLRETLDDSQINIGPSFVQQGRGKGSIPDGVVSQQSFRVVIETKLHASPELGQLSRHLDAFSGEQVQVLLVLTSGQPDASLRAAVEERVAAHNTTHATSIAARFATFQSITRAAQEILPVHEYAMIELVDDYAQFCSEMGLLPRGEFLMRAAPCGTSLQQNFQYSLYYDPIGRTARQHAYVGLYAQKSIRGIGKVANVVEAEWTGERLEVLSARSNPSAGERDRIRAAISGARLLGWDIARGHRFVLVDRFYETDYKKTSPGPMRGAQYFDLGERLTKDALPDPPEIAKVLSGLVW